ncbi:glycoside hydrolase family 44 protein [Paenibacillus chartarius]|uniref:Glycoside hydrolase family 44 protein n=1 Tax=Paenibacillus chartarius TaxID=747481 RepID=A0ABV6DUV5_9BACL
MKKRLFHMSPQMKPKLSFMTALVVALTGVAGAPGTITTPKAQAAEQKLAVYDDQLNSEFTDYGWADHTLTDTTTVHGGSHSIRMKPRGDDGLYLYKDRIALVSDYPVLELWVNGGQASGQKLEVVLQAGGEPVAAMPLDQALPDKQVKQGVWQKAMIDIGKMNVPNGLFDGILIRGTVSGEQPDVYFDDITLTNGGVVAERTITRVVMSAPTVQLKKGASNTLFAIATYSDSTSTELTEGVQWSSSDPAVATVEKGRVIGVKAGTATIAASHNGLTVTSTVTVTEDAAVLTGIALSSSALQLKKGATGSITASGIYSDGTTGPLTGAVQWSSSDSEIAAVTASGAVYAVKAGTAVITARSGGFTGTATVTVTEAQNVPPIEDDGQAALKVFDDELNPEFADYSWAQRDLNEADTVHTGTKSISFDPSSNGALYFYRGAGAVNVKDHDRLEFWINGGEAGGQQVELVFNSGGQAAGRVNIGSVIGASGIPANGWTKVLLDLPSLGIENGIFDALVFRGLTDGAQPNVYLDDIRLLEKYVAPPVLTEGVLSQYGMVIAPGDTAKLTYEARYSNGTSEDVSAKAAWTSNNPDIVTVNNGVLTAVGTGLAKITGQYGSTTSSAYVQVISYTPEAAYIEGLAEGYSNWSWGTSNFDNSTPAASGSRSISFQAAGYQGIWLHRDKMMDMNGYYGISMKVHGGTNGGQQLHVNLNEGRNHVGSFDLAQVLPNGIPAGQWTEVKLKFADLGVDALSFDGIVVHAWGEHDQGTVYFDDINMLKNNDVVDLPEPELPSVNVTIDSTQGRRTLSPGIFGINFEDTYHEERSTLGFPIKRWGGNAMTRYNWELDTTNRGGDWFFLNVPYGEQGSSLADQFIGGQQQQGADVLLQVPTIGWTPKSRDIGWSFSIQKYGAQQSNECAWGEAWCRRDAGNGRKPDGSYMTGNDPTDTSKQVGPDFITRWIEHLKEKFGGYVHKYALDNEPMLWPHSHWDVHPQMTTYDEVWNYTKEYASAIKAADPQAEIFGPVPWGWCEYFYSAKDGCYPGEDMAAHGDKPYLEWFLSKVEEHRQQTGQRLVDVLDIHYYPAEDNIPFSTDESPAMTKRRFNSLKSLYDPAFVDPSSWIQEPVKLLPRMRDMIERNAPGTKLSISEYNFGDGTGIGSGLAQAEALALFAREGVDYAMRWGALDSNTPLEDAFKIFLNYDGQGSKVEGEIVSTFSSNGDTVGAYTFVSQQGKKFVLLINKDTAPRVAGVAGDLSLNGPAQLYRFDAKTRLAPAGTVQGTAEGLSLKLPARSATLVVIE